MTVKTNDLSQRRTREHRLAVGFFFQNNLEQDTAGQVFIGFGVNHNEIFVAEHKLLHIGHRDVRTGLSIVEAAIRIFLNQPLGGFLCAGHLSSNFLRCNAIASFYG